MKSILILGDKGMAGRMIANYLSSLKKYNLNGLDRDTLDVKDQANELTFLIKTTQPDIIINCIGILVKPCSDNPENGIWLNSYFPHYLAKLTKGTKTKVIHLSTDCVFKGDKGPYKDNVEPDGIGIYARSKILGEIVNDKDLTIRMSIIGPELNPEGSGLFAWFMRQQGRISGYSEVLWSGITTLELAKAVDAMIEANITGFYQLAPKYFISKFDLLKTIQKVWKKRDVIIKADDSVKHDKTLICSKQKIPNYTMPKSYEIMLTELKEFIECYL